MKDQRRSGAGEVEQGGGGAAAATPGKRTLIEQTVFAPASVAPEGAGAPAPVPIVGGGDVENPLGNPGADATPNTPRTRTTVTFQETAAPPLTFNAATYRELYGQVAARSGQEAGSVKRTPILDTKDDGAGNVTQADFTYKLETMLPEWPQKATQPAPDQAKFAAWRGSVSDHEAQHRAIYKRDLAKVKTQVIGPTSTDVDTQEAAVEAAAETAQDAFDASNQPAPLAVPGGIEKVPGNSAATDASNDPPAGDPDSAAV